MRIETECCEGIESKYGMKCLQDRCPTYKGTKEVVDQGWPYVGTGFGNLYGNPGHDRYLAEVRASLKGNPQATRVNKK